MLAAPAQSGLGGEFDFHDRSRIGKHPVAKRAGQFADGVGEFLQAAAYHLVIVAALCIT